MPLTDWVDRFAVWNGVHPDLQTLLIYGVGIALYTALVFTFYQLISQRDPAHSRERGGWWGKTVRVAETALTFPVISFGYFAVLSLALMVMSKETTPTSFIVLLSMAAVLGVRVTAHVSEPMANDLAKLLPLSLLAVVLVDPGYLKLGTMVGRVGETIGMVPVLLQYFVLFILSEAVLRAARGAIPGVSRLWTRVERRRTLSKKAMLREVEHEHGAHRGAFHEHGPRAEKATSYVALDENAGGKPGSRQGVGPALKAERAAAGHAPRQRSAAPRAGPGGAGGSYTRV